MGLEFIAMATTRRTDLSTHKTSTERRYFIGSDARASVETIAGQVRGHWGIENSLHWVLDMAFNEDQARRRAGRIVEMTALRTSRPCAISRSICSKMSPRRSSESPTNAARPDGQCSATAAPCCRFSPRAGTGRSSRIAPEATGTRPDQPPVFDYQLAAVQGRVVGRAAADEVGRLVATSVFAVPDMVHIDPERVGAVHRPAPVSVSCEHFAAYFVRDGVVQRAAVAIVGHVHDFAVTARFGGYVRRHLRRVGPPFFSSFETAPRGCVFCSRGTP